MTWKSHLGEISPSKPSVLLGSIRRGRTGGDCSNVVVTKIQTVTGPQTGSPTDLDSAWPFQCSGLQFPCL